MQNEEFQVCLSIYLEEERRDEEQLSAVGGPISKVSQEIWRVFDVGWEIMQSSAGIATTAQGVREDGRIAIVFASSKLIKSLYYFQPNKKDFSDLENASNS